MLHKTNGIVLRSVKYGDTSLITTIFTSVYGVQAYMVQGVRTARSRQNKGAFFQPGTLLEMVVYHQPQKNLHRISQYQAAHIYSSVQQDVVKNSVALFSVEILLRLLPEHAPMPELYDFAQDYFIQLDRRTLSEVANFPLFFIIQCSRYSGFDLKDGYSAGTPYLNIQEGGFTAAPYHEGPPVNDDDVKALSGLLNVHEHAGLAQIHITADTRLRLIDWYIAFLQLHTQHMGNIRSLPVLRAILH